MPVTQQFFFHSKPIFIYPYNTDISNKLNNGQTRKFLMDDDTLIIQGFGINKNIKIGFGEVRNRIVG